VGGRALNVNAIRLGPSTGLSIAACTLSTDTGPAAKFKHIAQTLPRGFVDDMAASFGFYLPPKAHQHY